MNEDPCKYATADNFNQYWIFFVTNSCRHCYNHYSLICTNARFVFVNVICVKFAFLIVQHCFCPLHFRVVF